MTIDDYERDPEYDPAPNYNDVEYEYDEAKENYDPSTSIPADASSSENTSTESGMVPTLLNAGKTGGGKSKGKSSSKSEGRGSGGKGGESSARDHQILVGANRKANILTGIRANRVRHPLRPICRLNNSPDHWINDRPRITRFSTAAAGVVMDAEGNPQASSWTTTASEKSYQLPAIAGDEVVNGFPDDRSCRQSCQTRRCHSNYGIWSCSIESKGAANQDAFLMNSDAGCHAKAGCR